MTLEGKTILFFAGPLYEDLELWYPKIRLEEEGARTVVAGTGEKSYQGKRGYPLTVDTSVDQLDAKDFDGSKKSAIDAVQISVTASTSTSLSTRFTV